MTRSDLLKIPLLRDLMLVSGRQLDMLAIRQAGDEVLGYMTFLDVDKRTTVSLVPNERLPEGGPYVPVNVIPEHYLNEILEQPKRGKR